MDDSNVVRLKHLANLPENSSTSAPRRGRGPTDKAIVTIDAPSTLVNVLVHALNPRDEVVPCPIQDWESSNFARSPLQVPLHLLVTTEPNQYDLDLLDSLASAGPRIAIWTTETGVWSVAFGPSRTHDWPNFGEAVARIARCGGTPLTLAERDACLNAALEHLGDEVTRNPNFFGQFGKVRAWHDQPQLPHVLLPPPVQLFDADPLDDHRLDPRANTSLEPNKAALPLIDPYTGIITEVRSQHGMAKYPARFAYAEFGLTHAGVAPVTAPNDAPTATAKVGEFRFEVDPSTPTSASILRALARYCSGIHSQGEIWYTSRSALMELGEKVIDPAKFDYVLTRSLSNARSNFDLSIWWIKGSRDGTPTWVPRDTVFRAVERGCKHPQVDLSGLGSGVTYATAREHALRDLICQDSIAVWWTRGGVAPEVDIPAVLRENWVTATGAPCLIELRLFAIDNTHGLPTVAAVVGLGDAFGFGSYAHEDAEQACVMAATEALLHMYMQTQGLISTVSRRQRDAMLRRISSSTRTSQPITLADSPLSASAALAQQGWEVIDVDLTTDDARACGCFVVRAIVPGLASPLPGFEPSPPMGRILRAAVSLGWENNPTQPAYFDLA